MYECSYCDETFENGKVKANHVRWEHEYEEDGYTDEGLESMKEKKDENLTERYGEKIREERSCKKCEEDFEVEYRKEDSTEGRRKFCSQSCAASFNNRRREHDENTKRRISESLQEMYSSERGEEVKKKIVESRGDLSKEAYSEDPNYCEICESKIDYERKSSRTCSRECCNKLISKLHKKNPEVGGYSHNTISSSNGSWYYNENTDQEVWLDSSWEVEVAELLDELEIEWVRPEPISWINSENEKKLYYPDFYLTNYDLYLDPKNQYCMDIHEEKMSKVESKVTIKYGSLEKVKGLLMSCK